MLIGPIPPSDYACNGCTWSSDSFWHEAWHYHDYFYSMIRGYKIEASLSDWEVHIIKLTQKSERWCADRNLRLNIRLCAKTQRQRVAALPVSWIYYLGVRLFGRCDDLW